MGNRKARKNECGHLGLPHFALGLCSKCYNKKIRENWTEAQKARVKQLSANYWKNDSSSVMVYAYFSPDGKVDYVGRGTPNRVKSHKTKSKWWTPQHMVLTMTCDSEWHAMEMEGKWGARYLPRYNKEGYRHESQQAN